MNLRLSSLVGLIVCGFSGSVLADPSSIQMLPPIVAVGEGIGSGPHRTSIGDGKVAVGSPNGLNRSGVQTGCVYEVL